MLSTERRPWCPKSMVLEAWLAVALALLSLCGVLLYNAHRFDWDLELTQIPALPLMTGLMLAGIVFLAVFPLIKRTETETFRIKNLSLSVILLTGITLRFLMLMTEPALEDDQQRYLFEGAMVAHGISPYRYSPKDAEAADRSTVLGQLADASRPVVDRINHPALKTIYPPVAQAWFALSYKLGPFNLTAWRLILIAAEGVTVALLLRLLVLTGRQLHWIALYWWNPIAVKEIANSAHMEGVLMLLVVAAVYLAARARHLWAATALGFAIGVKIWPVLLAPLLLRPLLDRPRLLCAAATIIAGLSILWAVPIVMGGLNEHSGFLAYAQRWQANGALLPALRDLLRSLAGFLGFPIEGKTAGMIARIALATVAASVALSVAIAPLRGPLDLMRRVAWVTLVLVLVSPAQFPWYALWTLPFLVFQPRWSVIAMAITLPIYYSSFHFSAIGAFDVFRDRIVWLIWLPIWTLFAWEMSRGHPEPSTDQPPNFQS